MKNELIINGTTEINGKEIKVIEGGFGEGCKILTDKQIAEIHNMEIKHIRENINNNRNRFKDGVDIVDFKVVGITDYNLEELGYTKMRISKAKNIYALSERGYSKLIKIMDTDLAWEIHDILMDHYFSMRQVINSDEQLKAQLLLNIYNGGQEGILASKKLSEMEVKEATLPLLNKIEEDKPLVEFGNTILKSSDNILVRELAKIASDEGMKIGEKQLYKKLREFKYIMQNSTEPYQSAINQGLFVVEEKSVKTPYKVILTKTTKVTPKGQVVIIEKLKGGL